MDLLGIIPSRYASTRFPGKPLVNIGGKPMIQHVYENASIVLDDVIVATDDSRIEKVVLDFGGRVIMTGEHNSGTDRCCEALNKFAEINSKDPDIVINIQGDEPFINSDHIEKLIESFDNSSTQIATIIKKITSPDELFDPNIPKVISNIFNEAIYFSRQPIPFLRGQSEEDWIKFSDYFKHIGIYAYRSNILREITQLTNSKLENAESLEQLRWIENGYKIKLAESLFESYSIDTPEDLKKLNLD